MFTLVSFIPCLYFCLIVSLKLNKMNSLAAKTFRRIKIESTIFPLWDVVNPTLLTRTGKLNVARLTAMKLTISYPHYGGMYILDHKRKYIDGVSGRYAKRQLNDPEFVPYIVGLLNKY